MTRIKCCGMTRVEDARLAVELGADAIGVVLTARSRRQVSMAQAVAIVHAMPPFVSTVALFMNDDAEFVRKVMQQVKPSLLQFHGNESDAWCAQFAHPFLKSVAMAGYTTESNRMDEHPHAAALLLDGHGIGEAGGSGQTFDWSLMPDKHPQPLILAGGLNQHNVAQAIRTARPWAVDVASGIESAPGTKDPQRMAAFIRAVRVVDTELAQVGA